MIKIAALSKSFINKKALDKIEISFDKGKIYGVVGENGAGKTTLFRCIAGLEKYKGTITYDGENLKKDIGYLATVPYMISKLTGEEYLRLLCNARGIKLKSADEKNIFDLPLKQYADTYSTGMQKKLALTGILLQKNQVFILDEPFNGVDIASNMIINELLFKLKSLNKVLIISSHIFSTLRNTCDLIYQLKEGQIINSAAKNDFDSIEQEMRTKDFDKKIAALNLE